jgi:hypothetical protein
MAKKGRGEQLAQRIFELSAELLRGKHIPDIVERQFFFLIWSERYLRTINHLRKILPMGNSSIEHICQEALQGQGFSWLETQNPRAGRILRRRWSAS